jgi:hypothetical protein
VIHPGHNRTQNHKKGFIPFLVVLCFLWLGFAQTESLERLEKDFAKPPDDSKIMMRWWWFGPSVVNDELDREMRLMKDGGIGGFEVQPVYALALDNPAAGIRNLPYLSNDFIESLRYAAERARELGLRVDLTIGSGWPYGGPTVPITQAAGRLRVERLKLKAGDRRVLVPHISNGESLIAAFLTRSQGQAIDPAATHEILGINNGAFLLPEDPGGATEVLFFISSRSGQQVKRAAVGAEGFVLDHYDRTAIENYLTKVGDRLLEAFKSQPPKAIFCDSLEVYLSDWTPDFLDEFQERRGYDLKPFLPALVGDFGPDTPAIRHDWGRTLTELLNERFMAPMRDWAKRHNTLFRVQGYGIPPATISSNALADLPEGEGPQWKTLRASRWASSASHLFGRKITSSETWTWLHSPVFRATPLDMKAEADLHFLQGINQLIGHGWPYTAPGVEYPGWRFYAAAVFDEKNPWWIVMPDISRYLQRVSFMMRQGSPANDVAIYLPNADAWSSFRNGQVHMIEALRERIGDQVVASILEGGYGFDFFDDDALKLTGRLDKGVLQMGSNRYKAVILPNVERMPIETLLGLEEFAKSGGIVVATRRWPIAAPGLKSPDAEKALIKAVTQRLFEAPNALGIVIADEAQLAGKLATRLKPDVDFSSSKSEMGFVHRHTEDAEIYFVANTSNKRQQLTATFRDGGSTAEFWDPFTGTIAGQSGLSGKPAPSRSASGTAVPLDIEPYGSRIIVFRRQPSTVSLRTVTAGSEGTPVDLSTNWRVTFNDQRTMLLENLRSWADGETRYYSGVVTYERALTLSEAQLRARQAWTLDFGETRPIQARPLRNGMQTWLEAPVREAAVVYVNGERAGSVWCPPYRLEVGKHLKAGENQLRILVANTAMNFMAGHKLPDYKLLNLRYGEKFQAQDMDKVEVLPSGLMGPVKFIGTP